MDNTQQVPPDQARPAVAGPLPLPDATPAPLLRDGTSATSGSQAGSQADPISASQAGSQSGSQAFGSQSGSQAAGSQTGSQVSGPLSRTAAPASPAAAPRPAAEPDLWKGILTVAWIAVALGFVIEVLLVVLATSTVGLGNVRVFVADLVQKVSWSFLVCVGIAFGTAATRARPQVMGLLGLLAAPLAFNVARILHKGAGQALSVAAGMPPGVAPYLIGLLKAVEYGVLGWVIGQLGKRGSGIGAHLGAGLAIGVTFGVGIVAAIGWMSTAPSPLPAVLGRGINEVLFPIGCSLALYAANVLGKRAAG
jgi:hypothetical protein